MYTSFYCTFTPILCYVHFICCTACRLFKAGKIKDLYADQDWTQRLLQMRRDFPDAPVILIKGGVLPVAL